MTTPMVHDTVDLAEQLEAIRKQFEKNVEKEKASLSRGFNKISRKRRAIKQEDEDLRRRKMKLDDSIAYRSQFCRVEATLRHATEAEQLDFVPGQLRELKHFVEDSFVKREKRVSREDSGNKRRKRQSRHLDLVAASAPECGREEELDSGWKQSKMGRRELQIRRKIEYEIEKGQFDFENEEVEKEILQIEARQTDREQAILKWSQEFKEINEEVYEDEFIHLLEESIEDVHLDKEWFDDHFSDPDYIEEFAEEIDYDTSRRQAADILLDLRQSDTAVSASGQVTTEIISKEWCKRSHPVPLALIESIQSIISLQGNMKCVNMYMKEAKESARQRLTTIIRIEEEAEVYANEAQEQVDRLNSLKIDFLVGRMQGASGEHWKQDTAMLQYIAWYNGMIIKKNALAREMDEQVALWRENCQPSIRSGDAALVAQKKALEEDVKQHREEIMKLRECMKSAERDRRIRQGEMEQQEREQKGSAAELKRRDKDVQAKEEKLDKGEHSLNQREDQVALREKQIMYDGEANGVVDAELSKKEAELEAMIAKLVIREEEILQREEQARLHIDKMRIDAEGAIEARQSSLVAQEEEHEKNHKATLKDLQQKKEAVDSLIKEQEEERLRLNEHWLQARLVGNAIAALVPKVAAYLRDSREAPRSVNLLAIGLSQALKGFRKAMTAEKTSPRATDQFTKGGGISSGFGSSLCNAIEVSDSDDEEEEEGGSTSASIGGNEETQDEVTEDESIDGIDDDSDYEELNHKKRKRPQMQVAPTRRVLRSEAAQKSRM